MSESISSFHCTANDVATGMTNAAIIGDSNDIRFLKATLNAIPNSQKVILVSNRDISIPDLQMVKHLDFVSVALSVIPISFENVQKNLKEQLLKVEKNVIVLIDMFWGLETVSGSANFELWGMLCDCLNNETGHSIISLYHRNNLIDDQLLAALRGHRQFLSPAGIHSNPFWLPPRLMRDTSMSQQVDYLLGQIMPDYQGQTLTLEQAQNAATGASPEWIKTLRHKRPIRGNEKRWKIRCFGRLRIYLSDGVQVNWNITGSAPKKTRALFAYLLQHGERGAAATRIADFLWPDLDDEHIQRSRLHHCVTMLRKTLGGKEFLIRNGEYYQLLPPSGSWIDVSDFEQLCRQAKVLATSKQINEAKTLLLAAERLYTGDLFEDLMPEYVENEAENWCLPQRIWLRDMVLKVYRDLAEILREEGQLQEALAYCINAINMEPTSEMVHIEAMNILHAQGRKDAISRQYRQYLSSLATLGIKQASIEISQHYQQLMDNQKPRSEQI